MPLLTYLFYLSASNEVLKELIIAKDGEVLAEYLKGRTLIKPDWCCIGIKCMVMLVAELSNNDTFTRICLHDNNITDERYKVISTVLRTHGTITEIDLEGDNVGNEGGKVLEGMFDLNNTMTRIDLVNNKIDGNRISSTDAAPAANKVIFPKGLRHAIQT